jgi:prolyl oligopeptidase
VGLLDSAGESRYVSAMPARRSSRPTSVAIAAAAVTALASGCGGSASTRGGGETADPTEESQPPAATDRSPADPNALVYPVARKGDAVDVYHGTKVADPYRWLEDTDSPDTRAWIEAENKVTFAFLEAIPQRKEIETRITELWNYEKYSAPGRVANRYFWSKNDGLQNQSVLYWSDSLKGEPKVLLDPNKLSADGTVALAGLAISENAKLAAYGLQSAGSDWVEWHVRSIDTGEDRPDLIKWSKFSGAAWTHDSKGFYYARYPEPKAGEAMLDTNLNQKLYYHRLGTAQDKDVLIYERPDEPKCGFGSSVTEDGRYLVVSVWTGTGPKKLVLYQDLKKN